MKCTAGTNTRDERFREDTYTDKHTYTYTHTMKPKSRKICLFMPRKCSSNISMSEEKNTT
jgi:hypothetical protein